MSKMNFLYILNGVFLTLYIYIYFGVVQELEKHPPWIKDLGQKHGVGGRYYLP